MLGCCFCTSLGFEGEPDRQGVPQGRSMSGKRKLFIGVFGVLPYGKF